MQRRRSLTVKNLYDKVFTTFPFTGIFEQAMGQPETGGAWIVYGAEKNGKTWFALLLAKFLALFAKVWYISAEEGTSKDFVEAVKRAGIAPTPSIKFDEYLPLEDVIKELKKRKAPKIVILDNVTIYSDELRAATIKQMLRDFPNVLFVFVAHEEDGKPYTAAAKLIRKLSKIIVQVKGLTAHVSGRCPGGNITVDEERAALYWGTTEPKTNDHEPHKSYATADR